MCLLLSALLPAGSSRGTPKPSLQMVTSLESLELTINKWLQHGEEELNHCPGGPPEGAERPQRPDSRVSQAALLASCMKPTEHTHAQPHDTGKPLTSKPHV